MLFALMIEPQQGLSYAEQLELARLAERLGFEAFFRSDHYRSFPGPADKPTTDAWTVLAGIARETTTIRLGALVSPVTFRHPGSFAKVVTTADEMSGGRVDVGVGAGWNEAEHSQLGLAFPEIRERADLMEDELAILHGLWEEPDGWSFEGRQVRIESASFNPKPVQRPHPPIIVGGEGSPRSLRLAARYADEYNMSSSGPEECAAAFARLDEECRKIGRDPATVRRSVMAGVLLGADEAEFQRRVRDQLEMIGVGGADTGTWLEARRPRWIIGTPEQARAMVTRFAAAGVERVMLQDMLPRDHAMIELAARELIGRV
ncbi:MAG TPA: TIGR03560 family F420-dependent LLM class oxidoreductase [Candidatus Limnocylindrales bacterium]|jgi:F420-dependent oxidoreductase-like protein